MSDCAPLLRPVHQEKRDREENKCSNLRKRDMLKVVFVYNNIDDIRQWKQGKEEQTKRKEKKIRRYYL